MRRANVCMGFRGMQWSHTVLETHPHLRNTQSLRVSGHSPSPRAASWARQGERTGEFMRAPAELVFSFLGQGAWGGHMLVSHVIL